MGRTRAETDVRNLGRELRAVVGVADALEQIDSLEQASRDAKELARQANEEAAVAIGKREQAREEVDGEQDALRRLRDAKAQIIAAGKNEADEIVANAEADAGSMIATAQKRVDALTTALDQAKTAHEDFMVGAADEAREVAEKIRVLREELAAIEKRITG